MAPSTVTPLMRAAAVRSVVRQNQRMGARSARQASQAAASAHGHDSTNYPEEGFSGAFWRNTILGVLLSVAVYRISIRHTPAAKGASIDEAHDPDEQPVEAQDGSMPYLTRYLAYHMPRQGMWKERADKHLELSLKQAEDQLLIQDAQRPVIRRLRYPGAFEQASPHGLSVGDGVDLSDLKVRPNFNAPVGESE